MAQETPFPISGPTLGAVLAGGRSVRFGSDKALALLGGRTLLEHAVEGLRECCGAVVVVGREDAPVTAIPDRPGPDMGPLGGIAAALHHARAHGFAAVLTCPVDCGGLAARLIEQLGAAPAYCESQPVIGLWPASALPIVDAILAGPQPHSMRRFAAAIGARGVRFAVPPPNINTPADLRAAEAPGGR